MTLFCKHQHTWIIVPVWKCVSEFADGITLYLCVLLFSCILISWLVPEMPENFSYSCHLFVRGGCCCFAGSGKVFGLWRWCNYLVCVDGACYFTRSIFFPHLRLNCYCSLGKYLCNLLLIRILVSELIESLIFYYITIIFLKVWID